MPTSNKSHNIRNGELADGAEVDQNFNEIHEFLNQYVIHVDGSKEMTAPLGLVDGIAASRPYVDERMVALQTNAGDMLVGSGAITIGAGQRSSTLGVPYGSGVFLENAKVQLTVVSVSLPTNPGGTPPAITPLRVSTPTDNRFIVTAERADISGIIPVRVGFNWLAIGGLINPGGG